MFEFNKVKVYDLIEVFDMKWIIFYMIDEKFNVID